MRELSVDLESRVPHELDQADAEWADVDRDDGLWRRLSIHTRQTLRRLGDYTETPAGLPPDEVRRIRDQIAGRTRALAAELDA